MLTKSFFLLPILFWATASGTSPVSASTLSRRTKPAHSHLTKCLTAGGVTFRVFTDQDWSEYATTFNARLEYIPAAIALPTAPEQVSSAVLCAAKNGFPVQPKSGGHSYASYSTGGVNGILMIDLENLNTISVDNATGIAQVGGGVRLGNLALGIWDEGHRALAHGTCPAVGTGGHFTHGGYGYSSRTFGLALDQIVALDVVIANGSYIHTNNESYPEIYYALRGAADSFGIVTTFHLQTSPAPPTVINFSWSFPDALSTPSVATDIFLAIQSVSLNSSVINRNIGYGVTISNNATSYTLHGTYFGTIQDFNSTISPAFLNAIPYPPGSDSTIEETDWITSLTLLGGAPTLEIPLHGYKERDNFYAKSVTTAQPFTRSALEAFFTFAYTKGKGQQAPVGWFSIINLYGGPDSQIGKIGGDSEEISAYAGFDDLWVVQNYGSVSLNETFPEAGIQFLDGLNDAMTNNMMGEYAAYLNYIDPEYTREEAFELYYGEPLFSRLKELKKELDPKNLFRNPQSIPV
ncbi:Glucooligosaccharide oxidase [Podospora fimiseda]|uniref:Glucooligosaccharide oxidase n=1 Tax=Podospora fimiseda TaxID=252190 RepID=A0AAN7GTF5_9PEZI|nr:Glucooligosaccharide oxidase [Podospora fimiseda]